MKPQKLLVYLWLIASFSFLATLPVRADEQILTDEFLEQEKQSIRTIFKF